MAHDQRDITLKTSDNPIEPTRTGPKTEQLRRKQRDEAADKDTSAGEGQVGYGNSRTADGESEKDAAAS